MQRGDCHFCHQPVTSAATAAWPVTGWEAERQQGGANRIIARERVKDGRIAHAACAELAAKLARQGISESQETLI